MCQRWHISSLFDTRGIFTQDMQAEWDAEGMLFGYMDWNDQRFQSTNFIFLKTRMEFRMKDFRRLSPFHLQISWVVPCAFHRVSVVALAG